MNTITFVYGLVDPDSNMLRYIGQTKNTVNKKLKNKIKFKTN
jgi:hypothetical protein